MKALKELLSELTFTCERGNLEKEVTAVVYDSRKIIEGCLFVCIKGANFDGHQAAAEAAEAEFNARFQKGAVPNDIKDVTVAAPTGEIGIMQLIKVAGLAPSNAEAGRNIDQGGVRIDGESVRDRTLKIQAGAEFVLQVGKRRWARVKVTA